MRISSNYPAIKKVLAENANLPEPLLRDAKVNFDYDVVQEPGTIPKFMVDKDSAQLELPTLSAEEAKTLPDQFEMLIQAPVEDIYARAGKLQFKFAVDITGRDQKKDGSVELKFNATVEGIKDVSRS